MKVTVYSGKGGAGKTPISLNLALNNQWAIGTNDMISVLSLLKGLPEDTIAEIPPDEEFPEFPKEIDMVFDLGGALARASSPSILSAIKQSDCVLVPIEDNIQSIAGGILTINEIQPYAKNICVIGTKLKRKRHELKAMPIERTQAFQNIKAELADAGLGEIKILPLRFSEGFETIFKEGLSIEQIVGEGGLRAYSYRDLKNELDAITKYIQSCEG